MRIPEPGPWPGGVPRGQSGEQADGGWPVPAGEGAWTLSGRRRGQGQLLVSGKTGGGFAVKELCWALTACARGTGREKEPSLGDVVTLASF